MKRGIHKGQTCDPHAVAWAAITLVTFPFVALCANIAGFGPLASFIGGAVGSMLVLLAEFVTCGRLWLSDPCIEEWFSHPASSFRLLSVVGLLLLMFQTFVIMGFMASKEFDASIIQFVMARQCEDPSNTWFARICRSETPRTDLVSDPVSTAMREEAARRLFPGSQLVTCATQPIKQERDDHTVTRTAIVRCDQWIVGSIVKRPTSFQSTTALIAASLHVEEDGSYRVDEWSDDPSSEEWEKIAGSTASATEDILSNNTNISAVRMDLAAETEDRIFADLQRR
jgi:hypothetical protein